MGETENESELSCPSDQLNEELHLGQFKGSEGTVKFIRVFDKLFDALNSRNFLGKGSKAPMRHRN